MGEGRTSLGRVKFQVESYEEGGESSFARKINAKRYTQARVSKKRTGVGGTTLYKLSPGRKREGNLKLSPALAGKIRATCTLAMTKSLGRADHRQSANPRNEETWFLVPLFFPTETSRPAHCLAFDFCHFLHLELIFAAIGHGARRWAMRRGRELITGGGGAPRAPSRAHAIRRFTSSLVRSHANNRTSCAFPKQTARAYFQASIAATIHWHIMIFAGGHSALHQKAP